MNITANMVNNVLSTLPVSYYCGRDIPITLDETGDATYYNHLADTITIGYKMIESMAAGFDEDEKDLEGVLRAFLYHEISHGLMTPRDLKSFGSNKMEMDVINVFEDERMETLLQDKFYGVDFKQNAIKMNGYKGEQPESLFSAFYFVTRFRKRDIDKLKNNAEHVKRVGNMINIHDSIIANSNGWDYARNIISFFKDFAKDWFEENKKEEILGMDPNYDSKSESEQRSTIEKMLEQEAEAFDKEFGDTPGCGIEVGEGEEGEGEGTGIPSRGGVGSGGEDKELEEKIKELAEAVNKEVKEALGERKTKTQKMLDTMMNKFIDNDLTEKIAMVFENFLSRNKNNSCAMQRYSGVIDPRALGTRDDWRIWNYKAQTGPIKGYDKLHLNLFIDTSGSFYDNQDKVNTLLKSLDSLEKKYPFFDFDLVTCQVSEKLRTKEERYIIASGGNDLDEKVFRIFNDLQSPNSFNYNIILFDGDAFTDCRGGREKSYKNFGAFNSSKCSIISDTDNERMIKQYAPLADSIFMNRGRRNYSEQLFDNIINVLTRALL